jgi:hypothetical protein
VDLKKLRTTIEGIFRTKKDGTKVSVYFDPSNLQIKELNLEDKKRKNALERKISVKSPVSSEINSKKFKAKPLPQTQIKENKENK